MDLSEARDNYERANVLYQIARKRAAADTNAFARKREGALRYYQRACAEHSPDEIAEHYACCGSERRAWREAIEWARAFGLDYSTIQGLERRAEQAANTGD